MQAKDKKIFIADDDADILQIIGMILKTQGYQVVTSTNAKDIFKYAAKDLPDIILLDIWMSGIDGRDICSQLKSQELTKNIPVLFISANSNIEEIAKTYKADGYIAKPFEMDHLLERINAFFSYRNFNTRQFNYIP